MSPGLAAWIIGGALLGVIVAAVLERILSARRAVQQILGQREPVVHLGEHVICGAWPINPGDRVRILVSVPEYGTEIGHAATCVAVWPGDDVEYRFKLDGRAGRDSVITFLDTELWQLERIPA